MGLGKKIAECLIDEKCARILNLQDPKYCQTANSEQEGAVPGMRCDRFTQCHNNGDADQRSDKLIWAEAWMKT